MNVGSLLGKFRTAAIGGAAIDVLSRKDSRTLCIIGPGQQGSMQARAACSVRDIERIFVYRRNQELLKEDSKRLSRDLGVEVVPVDKARDGVENADIVVVATNSPEPVIKRF